MARSGDQPFPLSNIANDSTLAVSNVGHRAQVKHIMEHPELLLQISLFLGASGLVRAERTCPSIHGNVTRQGDRLWTLLYDGDFCRAHGLRPEVERMLMYSEDFSRGAKDRRRADERTRRIPVTVPSDISRRHFRWLAGAAARPGARWDYMIRHVAGGMQRWAGQGSSNFLEAGLDGDDCFSAAARAFALAQLAPPWVPAGDAKIKAAQSAMQDLAFCNNSSGLRAWAAHAQHGFDDAATVRWALQASNWVNNSCGGDWSKQSINVLLREYPRLRAGNRRRRTNASLTSDQLS